MSVARAYPLGASLALALLLACNDGTPPVSGPETRGEALSGGASAAPTAPEGWMVFEVTGAFSFRGPPDLRAEPVSGIDSQVARWRNEGLEVFADYGWYSDPLTSEAWQGAQRSAVEIDGRAGVLVRLGRAIYGDGRNHVAALHVPDVGDGQTRLSIVIRGMSTADGRLAEQMLRSVRWAERP